ncbi:unnamed protein product [Ectocarpus sp. 12 AP-2014]
MRGREQTTWRTNRHTGREREVEGRDAPKNGLYSGSDSLFKCNTSFWQGDDSGSGYNVRIQERKGACLLVPTICSTPRKSNQREGHRRVPTSIPLRKHSRYFTSGSIVPRGFTGQYHSQRREI